VASPLKITLCALTHMLGAFAAYNCREDWTVCIPRELGAQGLDGHVMANLGNASAVAAACAETVNLPKGGKSYASPPDGGWHQSSLGWMKGTGNVGCGWGSTYSNVHPAHSHTLADFGRVQLGGFTGATAEVDCCIEAMKFEGIPIAQGGAAVRFEVWNGFCRIDREMMLRGNLDASSGKPVSQLAACGAEEDTFYFRHAAGAADAANLQSAGRCALLHNFTRVEHGSVSAFETAASPARAGTVISKSVFVPKGRLPAWDAELPNHACHGEGDGNSCAKSIVLNNINTAEACCHACASLLWVAESGNGAETLSPDQRNPCVAFQVVNGRCQILRELWFDRFSTAAQGRHPAGQHPMHISEAIGHCAAFDNHDACARADNSHGWCGHCAAAGSIAWHL